jgi:hypothetical protein
MRFVEIAVAATMLIAAGFGCGPTIYVTRPAVPLVGRVSIEVADRREPKRGGNDPSQIGVERSGWGIPYPIRVDGPAGLAMETHDSLAQAANENGIGVLAMGEVAGATSRLIIEIQNFWCDGYPPVFKAHAVLSATIIDGMTGQVRVPGQPLVADGDAGTCRAALYRMRRALYSAARGFFATPQLRAALIAEPAAAPPAPPPPNAPPPPPNAPPPSSSPAPMQPYGGQ